MRRETSTLHMCACTCRIFLCRVWLCACANDEARNWAAALRSGFSEWFRVISAFHPSRRPTGRAHLICHPPWENPTHAQLILRRASAAQGHFRTPHRRAGDVTALRNHNWFKSLHIHTAHKELKSDKSSAQMQPTRFEFLEESPAPLRSSQ